MSYLEFVVSYFTSPTLLSTLLVFYGPVTALLVAFRFRDQDPALRSRILVSVFMIMTFSWFFLASSLILCRALVELYEYAGSIAIGRVFSIALASSLAAALPFSVLVTRRIPDVLLARLGGAASEPGDNFVASTLQRYIGELGLSSTRFSQTNSAVPFAYSVGGKGSMIVVSKGLLELLDGDEIETVLAHELSHLKNGDTAIKVLVTVYRRVLFFDPVLRLMEAAIHREKEFLADAFSARLTRKPLSLASALVKIHSVSPRGFPAQISGLSIAGGPGFLRKLPSVKERVERLLKIADELGK